LTPQLTPEYQKTGEIDTKKLPSDLAEISRLAGTAGAYQDGY
jgi:hypothetical protein